MTSPIYLKTNYKNIDDLTRDVAQKIAQCFQGKTDNTGTFTLTANSATTVVTEGPNRIGQNTKILYFPTTANAATEFGAGTIYVSSKSPSSNTFTLTHVNNAQTDRTFDYVLIGQ